MRVVFRFAISATTNQKGRPLMPTEDKGPKTKAGRWFNLLAQHRYLYSIVANRRIETRSPATLGGKNEPLLSSYSPSVVICCKSSDTVRFQVVRDYDSRYNSISTSLTSGLLLLRIHCTLFRVLPRLDRSHGDSWSKELRRCAETSN